MAGPREDDDRDGGKAPGGASCWEPRGKEGTKPEWGSSGRDWMQGNKHGAPEPGWRTGWWLRAALLGRPRAGDCW